MNYIITKNIETFKSIGEYNYCNLEDMILTKIIALDGETTSLKTFKGELFCIQIGTGENNYLIDLETINIQDVIPYLEGKILVGHNIKFDLGWLYKHDFFPWKVRDTMIASQILYNGIKEYRHSFAHVMERELGLEYDKSEQKNIHKIKLSTSKAIEYCFNDVDKLLELDKALNRKIIDGGYLNTYQLHRRWIRACAYMEQCGLPINEQVWDEKVRKDIIEQKAKAEAVTNYIFDKLPKYRQQQLDLFSLDNRLSIEITSPKQMLNVFKDFGINVISSDKDEKTGEFKESISEDVISKSKHEFVDIWLEFQTITHDVSTFGENFTPSIYQGRLYTNYKPILDTARISAGGKNRSKLEVDDINTLNIPANEKSRRPFEAKKGYKLIVSDYSNQEGFTGADVSGDEAMIDSLINGKDLHCMFARVLDPSMAHLTDKEIKDGNNDLRQKAKVSRFALQFGGTGFTIHMNEGIPLDEANIIEAGYKELHKGVVAYGNRKLDESLANGYIESIYGFKLHFRNFEYFKEKHEWLKTLGNGFWKDYRDGKWQYKLKKEKGDAFEIVNQRTYDIYRKNASDISKYFKQKSEYLRLCLNNAPQTIAAHQTKSATNRIYEYIWKKKHFWKARIAVVVHDEVDMEIEDGLAEEYKEVVERLMVEEGNKFLTNPLLKMKVGIKICENWWLGK